MEKEITKTGKKREISGVVVSNKMIGTVRVKVEEIYRHAAYEKVMKKSKVFFAHTEEALNIGDKVTMRECKPYSKNVKWAIISKN